METADVKPCPHNYVFIDHCCACLIDMLKRVLKQWEDQCSYCSPGTDDLGGLADEDIKKWWANHKGKK